MTTPLQKYQSFVQDVTSETSNNTEAFIAWIRQLQNSRPDINVALLMTAAVGMASEGGEALDIVKKHMFHNKAITDEQVDKLVSEAGDVIWYWINMCRALGVTPEEVIRRNVEKLEGRHPNGCFNIDFYDGVALEVKVIDVTDGTSTS